MVGCILEGDSLRFIRVLSLVVLVLCLCMFYVIVRLDYLQQTGDMSSVVLTEAIFVVLLMVLFLTYLREERKQKQYSSFPKVHNNKIILNVRFLNINDDEKQTIDALIQDQLILGSDLDITHITFLKDEQIAPQHCSISHEHGTLYLSDLDTESGTFLNNHIINEKIELHRLDFIRLGNTFFQIDWS